MGLFYVEIHSIPVYCIRIIDKYHKFPFP